MAFTYGSLVNLRSTTLAQAMTTASPGAGEQLAVTDGAIFPTKGYALVGTELVKYTSVGVNSLYVSARAAGSTTAAQHDNAAVIHADVIVADHINELTAKFHSTSGHKHTGATDDAPGVTGVNLPYGMVTLAAAASMSNSGYIDGPKTSASVSVGNWLIMARAHVYAAAAAPIYAKLWDGVSVLASVQHSLGTGLYGEYPLSVIASVTTSRQWKISVSMSTSFTTGNYINTDSNITIVKIAP